MSVTITEAQSIWALQHIDDPDENVARAAELVVDERLRELGLIPSTGLVPSDVVPVDEERPDRGDNVGKRDLALALGRVGRGSLTAEEGYGFAWLPSEQDKEWEARIGVFLPNPAPDGVVSVCNKVVKVAEGQGVCLRSGNHHPDEHRPTLKASQTNALRAMGLLGEFMQWSLRRVGYRRLKNARSK